MASWCSGQWKGPSVGASLRERRKKADEGRLRRTPARWPTRSEPSWPSPVFVLPISASKSKCCRDQELGGSFARAARPREELVLRGSRWRAGSPVTQTSERSKQNLKYVKIYDWLYH